MGNTEALHDPGGDHFIERLLTEWVAAAFYKASPTVYDFQRFFRFPSEVLSGEEKFNPSAFLSAPNRTSPISSENRSQKVDTVPGQVGAFGTNPILIRQAQSPAAHQQHFGAGDFQRLKRFSHTGSAGRDGTVCPPLVERRPVGDPFSYRNAHRQMLRRIHRPDFCIKPVASSSSSSATWIRLCIRVHFKLFTSFLFLCGADVFAFRLRSFACNAFRFSICPASGSISSSCRYRLCFTPFSDH